MHRHLLPLLLLGLALLPLSAQQASPAKPFFTFEEFDVPTETEPDALQSPRWYRVEAGKATVSIPPPGQEFMLGELPKEILSQAQIHTLSTMMGRRHNLSNYVFVESDPRGVPLKTPFAIGHALYAFVHYDNAQGITFSCYYYDTDEVAWHEKATPGQPMDYSLPKYELARSFTLPSSTWHVIAYPSGAIQTIENNKPVVVERYTYLMFRIIRE